MKHISLLLGLLAVSAALFFSCQKDDIEISDAKLIPTRISFLTLGYGGGSQLIAYTFGYDENERLTEIRITNQRNDKDEQLVRKTTLVYDEEGGLIREEVEERMRDQEGAYTDRMESYTNTFARDGNTIRVEGRTRATYTTDSKGWLIRAEYAHPENNGTDVQQLEYDRNGNLILSRHNDEATRYTYAYDKRHGVYQYVDQLPQWYLTCSSLPFSQNRYNNHIASYRQGEKEFGYEYEYNSSDYPISQRTVYTHPAIQVCSGLATSSIEYQPSNRL